MAQAQTTIFEADFQGSADGAGTLANLDAGTAVGSWLGTPHNTLLDTDGGNRGALLEQASLNIDAVFASAGSLSNGVNISVEASPRRINNNARTMLIKGVASDSSVLFVLGLAGDTNAGDPAHGRLSYFDSDWTPDNSAGIPGTVTQTFVGNPGDFPFQQSNTYDVTDMTPFEVLLAETGFDIAIDGTTVATNVPYLSAATDIALLNFTTDFSAGTWFDNFQVIEQQSAAVPEPASVAIWTLIAAGLAMGYVRFRRKR